jgi:NAD/NADP transhydrogenase alpha subunit
MPAAWMQRQAAIIAQRCAQMDIVITTALIPGRPAPKLVRADTVAAMKPGSIIVDLAVEQGGNVEGSDAGQVVVRNGVKIVGLTNLPALVAADASALYARNVLNFVALSLNLKSGEFAIARDDEIVQATLVCEALHTPLMSVTNAISAIILVGAMLAAGPVAFDWGGWVGVVAVVLASINAFGGFLVTQRMLQMFKRREPAAKPAVKP